MKPRIENFIPPSQEMVICAAVIHCGIVFQGKRHNDAIALAIDTVGDPPVKGRECQGFWTSWNRYVNRRQAMQIAVAAGQVEQPDDPEAVLISEDLY